MLSMLITIMMIKIIVLIIMMVILKTWKMWYRGQSCRADNSNLVVVYLDAVNPTVELFKVFTVFYAHGVALNGGINN